MPLNRLGRTRAVSRPQALEAECHQGLVMPEPLATLDRAQVSDQAIGPAAHPDQPGALEVGLYARQHVPRMHCRVIPSNLDSPESTHPADGKEPLNQPMLPPVQAQLV